MATTAAVSVKGCAAAPVIAVAATPTATSPESTRRDKIIPEQPFCCSTLRADLSTKWTWHGGTLPAAAKEAIRVPQNLLPNERIRVCTHHNGPRLVARGPADHIGPRRIAGHDGYAADVPRRTIRFLLPVSLLGVGR
jgi:hypothetical protein